MECFEIYFDLSTISGTEVIQLPENDGDFPIRKRRRNAVSNVVGIACSSYKETELENVGLQLWNGCFLLADYIITNRQILGNKVIFELGAGVGFIGVVLKYIVKHQGAIITDYKDSIISLASNNITTNKNKLVANTLLPLSNDISNNLLTNLVECRLFDWKEAFNPFNLDYCHSGWTLGDRDLLNSHPVLYLAADVIYDDILTIHFFSKLGQMIKSNEELVLTIEKRINFSLPLQRELVNGYDLFLFLIHHESMCSTSISDMEDQILATSDDASLQDFINHNSGRTVRECVESVRLMSFCGYCIPLCEVTQYVTSYERTSSMEIWKISLS